MIFDILLNGSPGIVASFDSDFSAIDQNSVSSLEPAIAATGPICDETIMGSSEGTDASEALGANFPGEEKIAILGLLGSDSAGGEGFGIVAHVGTVTRFPSRSRKYSIGLPGVAT